MRYSLACIEISKVDLTVLFHFSILFFSVSGEVKLCKTSLYVDCERVAAWCCTSKDVAMSNVSLNIPPHPDLFRLSRGFVPIMKKTVNERKLTSPMSTSLWHI